MSKADDVDTPTIGDKTLTLRRVGLRRKAGDAIERRGGAAANNVASDPFDAINEADGHRLRVTRAALGISEKDAAAAYGVTLATYRRYERGAPQRRTQGVLNFAKAFDVSLDWLVGGDASRIKPHLSNRTATHVAILPVVGGDARRSKALAAAPRVPKVAAPPHPTHLSAIGGDAGAAIEAHRKAMTLYDRAVACSASLSHADVQYDAAMAVTDRALEAIEAAALGLIDPQAVATLAELRAVLAHIAECMADENGEWRLPERIERDGADNLVLSDDGDAPSFAHFVLLFAVDVLGRFGGGASA